MSQLDPFFQYYQKELKYLRNAGERFSREFPKIAKRLDLSSSESIDPHTERLIESFAFMSARLQRTIDDEFPRISTALLETLYPIFTYPTPSLTIACFATSPSAGKLTSVHTVAPETTLYSRGINQEMCYFKTCYPVDLAPIEVTHIDLITTALSPLEKVLKTPKAIKITLSSFAGDFKTMKLDRLRFYINENFVLQNQIYESLFAQEGTVVYPQPGEDFVCLPSNSLQHVGFEPEEGLIPESFHPGASLGHRLLQEYFCFPQKFMFFDLKNLDLLPQNQKKIDLYLSLALDSTLKPEDLSPKSFLLGCTPIINLFKKISEPLKLDQQTTEYRIVADQRNENTTEIHSILKVNAALKDTAEPKVYHPYFGFNSLSPEKEETAFWHSTRRRAQNPNPSGTDVYLSFIDFDFNPTLPFEEVVYAHLACTNRTLATQIPQGGLLSAEISTPASQIYCLERPTPPIYPPLEGKTQWYLITSLALSHLSLSNHPHALQSLKEIIQLYDHMIKAEERPEIDSLEYMKIDPIVRRIGKDAWRGFIYGTKITLSFSQIGKKETNAFLFASILNHFFPLYASVNSFTQLEIHNTKRLGVWKIWQPRSGLQELL